MSQSNNCRFSKLSLFFISGHTESIRRFESENYNRPIFEFAVTNTSSDITARQHFSSPGFPKSLQIINLSPLPHIPLSLPLSQEPKAEVPDLMEFTLPHKITVPFPSASDSGQPAAQPPTQPSPQFQLLLRCRNLDEGSSTVVDFKDVFKNSTANLINVRAMDMAGIVERKMHEGISYITKSNDCNQNPSIDQRILHRCVSSLCSFCHFQFCSPFIDYTVVSISSDQVSSIQSIQMKSPLSFSNSESQSAR